MAVSALLGKWITLSNGMVVKIGFLRTDCDAGVVDPHLDVRDAKGAVMKPLLVRLSDLSIIRELEQYEDGKYEDYDAAVLAMRGK